MAGGWVRIECHRESGRQGRSQDSMHCGIARDRQAIVIKMRRYAIGRIPRVGNAVG